MRTSRLVLVLTLSVALAAAGAAPAHAYQWSRTLKEGDSGGDARALQIRVAGWFPEARQAYFATDGNFGASTTTALKAFQGHYGLAADGVAGPTTFAVLDSLQDSDGSTVHFDWAEFKQNHNSSCSAKANAYAGTFGGGMVAPRRVKRNVKRLMWRLEALRAKSGGSAIGINSGFRSVAYNECIGGASASQHLYGTAADNRMAGVTNRDERRMAQASQFHGIGCYSTTTHNHFDLRMDNTKLPSSQHWWWPNQDAQGRDLAADGKPCWGETTQRTQSRYTTTSYSSILPTQRDIAAFEGAGEAKGTD